MNSTMESSIFMEFLYPKSQTLSIQSSMNSKGPILKDSGVGGLKSKFPACFNSSPSDPLSAAVSCVGLRVPATASLGSLHQGEQDPPDVGLIGRPEPPHAPPEPVEPPGVSSVDCRRPATIWPAGPNGFPTPASDPPCHPISAAATGAGGSPHYRPTTTPSLDDSRRTADQRAAGPVQTWSTPPGDHAGAHIDRRQPPEDGSRRAGFRNFAAPICSKAGFPGYRSAVDQVPDDRPIIPDPCPPHSVEVAGVRPPAAAVTGRDTMVNLVNSRMDNFRSVQMNSTHSPGLDPLLENSVPTFKSILQSSDSAVKPNLYFETAPPQRIGKYMTVKANAAEVQNEKKFSNRL